MIYRHYKGGEYQFVAEVTHAHNLRQMIVYKSLRHGGRYWVRPKEVFFGKVKVEGEMIRRFSPTE